MTKILLLEDQTILREGIISSLKDHPYVLIIGDAQCRKEGADLLTELDADLVIVGINEESNNVLDTIRYIKKTYAAKILVLAGSDNLDIFSEVMKAGASGYILKKSATSELIFGIQKVTQGTAYICSEVGLSMFHKFSINSLYTDKKVQVNLTRKELEILHFIAQGWTNQEIADKIFTSKRTVETHRKNLLEKTGCRNTATLMVFCITNEILTPQAIASSRFELPLGVSGKSSLADEKSAIMVFQENQESLPC